MTNSMPEKLFAEFISKLIAAGLPEQQARSFAEECYGYRDLCRPSFELSENRQLPSDDCFRTLKEALRIFESCPYQSGYARELDCVEGYLKMPYSQVIAAKKAMAETFGARESDIEELYAQDPEWLLISADTVSAFGDLLGARFSDPEVLWSIFKGAAHLGLESTQKRMDRVLELLGGEIGEQVIRNDLQTGPWLFYRFYSDPVGCIEYMLECGLTPGQVMIALKENPLMLYIFKENRKPSYNHDQKYIDQTIFKYKK